MSIVNAIGDAFHSIYELIVSFFTTVYTLVYSLVDQVVGFVTGVISLFTHTISGVLGVAGETAQFLIGNIFVILAIGAGGYFYLNYQKQQGNTVKVGNKKLN